VLPSETPEKQRFNLMQPSRVDPSKRAICSALSTLSIEFNSPRS